MTRHRTPRAVLVGMGETAGYCTGLVEGLRGVGIAADFLDLGKDPMDYAAGSRRRAPFRLARWLSRQRHMRRRPLRVWTILYRIAMLGVFARAILRYDAFVFRAGDSFFGLRELGLLRRLGKNVVVVFFGSDSRPSYMNGVEVGRGVVGHRAATATEAKRRRVERIERHASEVVCHTMSAQLHRRRSVSFLAVGIPKRQPRQRMASVQGLGGTIRALHAPSSPASKGTVAIREAVSRVQQAGVSVDLRVVTGRPNHEVLAAIGECDFVIDELQGDTPMAAFAAEAAAQGRPAIVAGYGWDELERHSSYASMPPAHLCHPTQLVEAITTLATDHDYRVALGVSARRFVVEQWAPRVVANRFVTLITGDTPDDWYFEPSLVTYAHGTGLDEAALRANLRSVIDSDGLRGFHVQDKPLLQARLAELAAGTPDG